LSPICPRAQRRPRTRPRPRRRSPAENRHRTEGLDRPWSQAGPRRSLRGARGGTGCPNLPQRPGSRWKSGRESLIFRTFIRGQSRPGAPLWQIWTRLCSGSSQEPHASHRGHALLRRISLGRRRRPATPTRGAHWAFSHQERRCGAGDRCGGGGVSRGARTGPGSRRGPSRAGRGLLGPVVEVLHIGQGRPCGWIPSFPHDSGVLSRMSIFSGRAPMCRRVRSAHGRISPALNAGVFPHDSADSPPAGPGRMCSTAPTGPGTAHPTRPTPHARPMPPDGDRPEDVTDLLIRPRSLPVRKARSRTTVKTLAEADDDR